MDCFRDDLAGFDEFAAFVTRLKRMLTQSLVSISRQPHPSYDYEDVRRALDTLLLQLGLDENAYGTAQWNPLKDFVCAGDKVLLKPNLIRQSHLQNSDWNYVITHHSVIEAVVSYVFKALDGTGEIIIADGPQTDSDFDKIYETLKFDELKKLYREKHGFTIQVLDLREEKWIEQDLVTVERMKLAGDPRGYTEFDLAGRSEFANHQSNGNYYGADYNFNETRAHHSNGQHRYRVSRSAIEANVLINLPKLKTHKKTGVTLSLKNLVGIHGDRNFLPHHTIGTPRDGGDEFPSSNMSSNLQSRLTQQFKHAMVRAGGRGGTALRALKNAGYRVFGSTEEIVRSGNWHGNDTTWRMALDLNKLLFYGNADGTFRDSDSRYTSSHRRYLTIVDGIIAGEGNGPMSPDAKPCGMLVGGFNPLAVDTVCATLMGFDYRKLPILARGWQIRDLPLADFTAEEIECVANVAEWNGAFDALERASHLDFKPHFGWTNHVERRALEQTVNA